MVFRYLLHVCVLIAAFEILHAFYFVLQSIIWMTEEVDFYDVLSLISSIIWLSISIALLFGILRDYYHLLALWLIFATIGFILDVLFVMYVYFSGLMDWNNNRGPFLLFLAIALEGGCIYIIHFYYVNIVAEESKDVIKMLGDYEFEYKQQQAAQEVQETVLRFNLKDDKRKNPFDLLKVNESNAPRIVNKKGDKERKEKKENKFKLKEKSRR